VFLKHLEGGDFTSHDNKQANIRKKPWQKINHRKKVNIVTAKLSLFQSEKIEVIMKKYNLPNYLNY